MSPHLISLRSILILSTLLRLGLPSGLFPSVFPPITAKCADLDLFLTSLPFEYVYTPDILDKAKYPSLRDDDDLPVLASAIIADVDILLTGDKDFAGLELEHPKILTPAQFIEQYQSC
jgi:hypothetical protein